MVVLNGCFGGQSRIPAAEWDPESMADKAMADLDKDGDGQLSEEELNAAPGLKDCLKRIDEDGNGMLSRQEVLDRIALYKEMRVGLTAFSCMVTKNKRPLANATVRLVPEPFLGGVPKVSTGTSSRSGHVQLIAEGEDVPAAAVGMFRVEITSTDTEIPAKYNTETTLGVEVAPVTKPDVTGSITYEVGG
jgi:hypothetical protein